MEKFPSSYIAGSPEAAQAALKDKMVARTLFAKKELPFCALEDLKSIPAFPQSQRALDQQLADLRAVANRLGLYDAADYLQFEQKERN